MKKESKIMPYDDGRGGTPCDYCGRRVMDDEMHSPKPEWGGEDEKICEVFKMPKEKE